MDGVVAHPRAHVEVDGRFPIRIALIDPVAHAYKHDAPTRAGHRMDVVDLERDYVFV